jgi:hypothetical protein
MNGHKFISEGVEEIFNGDVFIESAMSSCLTCGAIFEKIRLNYTGEFYYATDMSSCSGDTSAHAVEGVRAPDCSCLWCEGYFPA